MKRRTLSSLLFLWVLPLSAKSREPSGATEIDTWFPKKLGTLELTDRKKFASTQLGVSLTYSRGLDLVVSVFIYPEAGGKLSEDLTSPQVMFEFDRALAEVRLLADMHLIENLRLDNEAPLVATVEPCGRSLLFKAFECDRFGRVESSYLLLTTVQSSYIKIRASHAKTQPELFKEVDNFTDEIARVLARCAIR